MDNTQKESKEVLINYKLWHDCTLTVDDEWEKYEV